MFFIKQIEIFGFWGNRNIITGFDRNVNIFIGKNGTGKTTFLNILTAILSVDIEKILKLNFKKVTITLISDEKKYKTISVAKELTHLKYKISKNSYVIPIISELNGVRSPMNYRYHKIMLMQREMTNNILSALKNICILSTISVYRELHDAENNSIERTSNNGPLLDDKLHEMTLALSGYIRDLDKKVQEAYNKFQKNMLLSMLYDEKYDTIHQMSLDLDKINELHKGLSEAYSKAGFSNIDDRIAKHIDRIRKSISRKKSLGPNDKWEADDAFPLPLYMRTVHIVDSLKSTENEKCKIMSPYTKFKELFNCFTSKDIILDPYANKIAFKCGNATIELTDLSSGEKQLFIILVETLLKFNMTIISVTDEPELSLHIEWQRELLNAVKTINPQAQLLVATHSPEIAGSYSSKVICMEDITK